MLRTKKEVDRHVRELLNKIKKEDDRKSRGYNIARLYYNVDEYESARRYLSEFISLRPKSSDAHKLLGNIYEKLGQKEKAVQSYKTAYSISDNQKDLVPRICGLLTESEVDSETRTHWLEEGERLFPHHHAVVQLRQSVIMLDSCQSKDDQEKFFLTEIKANPLSLSLHIKLAKFLLHWGSENAQKFNEAFDYVIRVEARQPFPYSLEWYQTMIDVLKAYENLRKPKNDIQFEELRLSILDRYIHQSLSSSCGPALSSLCSINEAATRLQSFGSQLAESLKVIDGNSVGAQHMIAQYYFHLATLLCLRGKMESILHKDIYVGCVLLHSCYIINRSQIPSNCLPDYEAIRKHWLVHSQYRLSQSGHILNNLVLSYGSHKEYLRKIHEICSHRNTLDHIHNTAFGSSGLSKKSVHFHDLNFMKKILKFVDTKDLSRFDQDVVLSVNTDLREVVWLFLQYSQSSKEAKIYCTFQSFDIFRTIPFASSMNTVGPETLCHLDLIAFIVGVTFCRQANMDVPNRGSLTLCCPSVMADHLYTPEQGEWWNAAASLCLNRSNRNLDRFRSILQCGLESIRHLGHHIQPPVSLTLHLARFFTQWVSRSTPNDISGNEAYSLGERAEHYWSKVVAYCSKKSKGILAPGKAKSKLFDLHSTCKDYDEDEMESILEEGELFIANRLDQRGKREEAIHILSRLKSGKASFSVAMLYKKQAQALLGNRMWQSLSLSARKDYLSLLTKSRDALYLTLDRLKMPGVDSNDPLIVDLSEELTSVELCLSSAALDDFGGTTGAHSDEDPVDSSKLSVKFSHDLDLTNGNASGNGSWISPPSDMHSHMYSTPIVNQSSRSRQEARPSSERLDAQMRHLTDIQQNTIKNMEEHNSALRSQNETLLHTCQTMMSELKDRYLEQRAPTAISDVNAAVIDQLKILEASVRNLQLDVKSMSSEISDMKKMKIQHKPEPLQLLPVGAGASDAGQVPIEIASPALQSVYSNYMSFCGQPAIASPLATHPAIFNSPQPPFLPPATIQDQVYMYPSPADIKKQVMNTSSTVLPPSSLYQAQSNTGRTSVLPNVPSSSMVSSALPGTPSIPPHSFQISLPTSTPSASYSNVITAPDMSEDESVFSTLGLLSNIPPPVYSAIAPSRSPNRPSANSFSPTNSHTPNTPGAVVSNAGGEKVISAKTVFPPIDSSLQTPPRSVKTSIVVKTPPSSFHTPPASMKTPSVASKSPPKSLNDSDRYVDDGHDPRPDFQPVIPLPDQIELITGEEEEKVLFEDRAKLFRFCDKEWKERGLGPIKILHNEGQGTTRVLMRREQTHKICCNHLITSSLDIGPMIGNEKAWIWAANDFADEKVVLEKFCCKFKTAEIGNKFVSAFNEGKELAKASETTKDPVEQPKSNSVKTKSLMGTTKLKPLSEMFKPNQGTWICDTCLVSNQKESSSCVSCQTPKPGAVNLTSSASVSKTETDSKPTFKFGIPPTSSSTPAKDATPLPSTVSSTPLSDASKVNLSTQEVIVVTPVASKTPATVPFGLSSSLTFGPNSSVSITPVKSGEGSSLFNKTTPTVSSTVEKSSEKFSMAGFTFSKAPSSLPPTKTDEQPPTTKEEPPKNSIFSNFAFVSSKDHENASLNTNSQFTFSFAPPSTAVSSTPPAVGIFSGASKTPGSTMSFSSLASEKGQTNDSIFKMKDEKSFTPQPLFGGKSGTDKLDTSTGLNNSQDDHVTEEFEPQVDFKPVVPLPDLVEVKTGEESEEKLFCERAKLFRFDGDSKEWKERGVGDVKLLQDKMTKKVRFLMRRDQTFKICANHLLTSQMKLMPLLSSEKTWMWGANDFADEEMKVEKFALRFKSVDLAAKFKTAFEDAQNSLSSNATEATDDKEETESTPSLASTDAASQSKPLSEMFKPSAGSWECSTCLVMNSSNKQSCVACSTPKEGASSSSTIGTIGPKASQPFLFSSSNVQPSTTPAFSFGIPSTTTLSAPGSSPFSFNWASKESASSSTENPKPAGFSFGSPGKYEFSFSGVQPTRSRDTSLCESENGFVEEEEDNLYFEPVIPLPDKVDVITGEENEEALHSQRAKLFRLRDGEFKERGIGDIKILKHKQTGRIRFLMRREHVHKICLNHYLPNDFQLYSKDEKSFYWVATDYSEEKPQKESFAVRFKTPEIADAFMKAVEEAKSSVDSPQASSTEAPSVATPTSNTDSSKVKSKDLEILLEKKASDEQIARARKLQLPDNFFLYETMEPCPGCIGCRITDDEQIFKIKNDQVPIVVPSPPVFGTPKTTSSQSVPSFSFGGSGTSSIFSSVSTTPTSNNIFGANSQSIFGGNSQSVFGGKPQTGSIFGGSSPSSGSIFSSNPSSTPSIFGSKPSTPGGIFGGGTTSGSIFGGNTTSASILGGVSSSSSIFDNKVASVQPSTPSTTALPVTSSDAANDNSRRSIFSSPSTPGLSFGDLAKQTDQPLFGGESATDVASSSAWVSKPLFSTAKTANDSLTNENHEEDEDYDPHYEPAIPMPELVQVTTGEEGWQNIFSHRAKLYRYEDKTKEWKERGVGEFKIQFEPNMHKYRLLQRREQVHKLSCNHFISPNMTMDYMSSSETAWCWIAVDFSERSEGEPIKFAVKFKSKEIAESFKKSFDESIEDVKNSQNATLGTKAVNRDVNDDCEGESDNCEREEIEEDDCDYEDIDDEEVEEEEEEEEELFAADCDLKMKVDQTWQDCGSNDLIVKYDGDAYGARIVTYDVEEPERCIVNCLIAIQTTLVSHDGTTVTWSGVNEALNPPAKVQITASFSDKKAAGRFVSTFEEGKDYAMSSNIEETCFNEVPEQDLYYGVGDQN